MPETSIPTPPGFAELPKAEQVRYLQALWDQISEHPDEILVPESHLQLAEERLRRYRENPSSARPAFEVIDRLSPQLKQATQSLMNTLPKRTVVVFEGQEHNAMDRIPQQFAETVTKFLSGH